MHVKQDINGIKEISGIMKKFTKDNTAKIYSQDEMEHLLVEHQIKSNKKSMKKKKVMSFGNEPNLKIDVITGKNGHSIEEIRGVLKHSITQAIPNKYKLQAALHQKQKNEIESSLYKILKRHAEEEIKKTKTFKIQNIHWILKKLL